MTNLANKRLRTLLDTLRKLRVWESQWHDLAYQADDVRGQIPDAEQPPEVIAERDRLRGDVSHRAALYAGWSPDAAAVVADVPLSSSHPFNIDQVRLAVSIGRWFAP